MPDQIQIILHEGDQPGRTVAVDKFDSVGILIKDKRHSLVIYNDCLLSVAFTFAFYNVTNNSHIYLKAVQKKNHDSLGVKRKFWCQPALLHKSEQLLKLEAAKLRDRISSKFEGNSKLFRKVMCKWKILNESVVQATDKGDEPLNLETSDQPSTEELPVMW